MAGSTAKKSIIGALILAALVAVFFWLRAGRSPVDRATQALTPPASARPAAPGEAAASEPPPGEAPPPYRTAERSAPARSRAQPPLSAAMQERRRRVLEALAARPASPPATGAPAAPAPAPAAAGESPGMRDRTGTMPETVEALNAQFGPLLDQCFDQARERGVNQRGMLALSVHLASAEGVGRIIESLEPADINEVDDAELIDCLRQSAFTVDLPEEGSGRTDFQMTIPYSPALADAGAPSTPR